MLVLVPLSGKARMPPPNKPQGPSEVQTKKPRVAAIGLDVSQNEAIEWLCSEMRVAASVKDYLERYSWTETDIAVVHGFQGGISGGTHVLMSAPLECEWDGYPAPGTQHLSTNQRNTEREVKVHSDYPEVYKTLAEELGGHINGAADPPSVLDASWERIDGDFRSGWTGAKTDVLVKTTSHFPLAVRHIRMYQMGYGADADVGESIVLALAQGINLSAWFRAFLHDVNKEDPERAPHAPPRLAAPSEWYTPKERQVAQQIQTIDDKVQGLLVKRERLLDEREGLVSDLRLIGDDADRGIRRAIWEDGDDLVEGVREILTGLGFKVQNMDAELKEEAKREDLRLTLDDHPGWEAIVEVKGYKKGTRTKDARQINEHRDRYAAENRRSPDLTLWIANPHRNVDPSSRPAPDKNVRDTAALIKTVYVSAADLYRQWALVASGSLEASDVVQRLRSSPPGLWESSLSVPAT